MKRRAVLAGAGLALTAGVAGCLDRIPGAGPAATLEMVEPELAIEDPPDVTVEDGSVRARGTVQYGSSSCGTISLAHAAYEASQNRLDLLVVAADDSNRFGGCTDDIAASGYQVEANANENLRRIAVTEHHAFGDTYSTAVDVTDW